MNFTMSTLTSPLLEKIAEDLDISAEHYEDAVLKYEDVGEWLGAPGSPLEHYQPMVYPQGSFRLGTVVRPITHEDQFDIDLVCRLAVRKESTTQADLKKLLGDRLKARTDLKKVLGESRRCWNLDFDHFHMDTLPCLPNLERLPNGILLTDTDLVRWQKSNPITYADWFRDRMSVAFLLKREALAKSLMTSVEDVPEWQVRTPLQRAVQLLKRHRDVYFAHDFENRPVSIIITTLAAHAYQNQTDIADALEDILASMERFIRVENGKYLIPNPVEPDENFADKWNEKPSRRIAFFKWLERAKADFGTALIQKSVDAAATTLAAAVGRATMQRAAKNLGISLSLAPFAATRPQVAAPGLATTTHVQTPPWREVSTYSVTVRGSLYTANRKKKVSDLADRAISKNWQICFRAETNVRAPYDVHWQIVNTGAEAEAVGELRGDFYPSSGPGYRWERTGYAGTHWVEAFVVKDGVCVARSGRRFVKVRNS